MLNQKQVEDLNEIRRLLHEAYEHYFEGSDGYHKSSEGFVTVGLGDYFQRAGRPRDLNVQVEIFSSVYGPNRHNYYDSTAAALEAVTKWHADEMATEYDENGDPI